MKITAIHTHHVCIPYDMGAPRQEFAGLRFATMDHLLIQVDTDAGITGWGEGFGHMNDVNCPWAVAEALEMERAYRPARLFWLEEPVFPPEDHRGLARVRREGQTRISAGENAAGLHDFADSFEKGAVDIAQPSVTKIGGITEMRKIIALAEAHSIELIPHCAYFRARQSRLDPHRRVVAD